MRVKPFFAAIAACLLGAAISFGAVDTTRVNVHAYASTNVTTSAYVTLVASTPISSGRLQICDTSTKLLKLAIGEASSEMDIATVQVSGCVVVPYFLAPGLRLSIKAIDASATTGYNTVAFIP